MSEHLPNTYILQNRLARCLGLGVLLVYTSWLAPGCNSTTPQGTSNTPAETKTAPAKINTARIDQLKTQISSLNDRILSKQLVLQNLEVQREGLKVQIRQHNNNVATCQAKHPTHLLTGNCDHITNQGGELIAQEASLALQITSQSDTVKNSRAEKVLAELDLEALQKPK